MIRMTFLPAEYCSIRYMLIMSSSSTFLLVERLETELRQDGLQKLRRIKLGLGDHRKDHVVADFR